MHRNKFSVRCAAFLAIAAIAVSTIAGGMTTTYATSGYSDSEEQVVEVEGDSTKEVLVPKETDVGETEVLSGTEEVDTETSETEVFSNEEETNTETSETEILPDDGEGTASPENEEEPETVLPNSIEEEPKASDPAPETAGPALPDEIPAADVQRLSVRSQVDFADHVTFIQISRIVDGEWVPAETFVDGEDIQVAIQFGYRAGELAPEERTLTYTLPDGIRPSEVVGDRLILDTGGEVATYTVDTNGTVTIVFDESFDVSLGFAGSLTLEGRVSLSEAGEDGMVDLGNGLGSIVVEQRTDLYVSKEVVKVQSEMNTEEAEYRAAYEVTFTPGSHSSGVLTVTDEIGENNIGADHYSRHEFTLIYQDEEGNEIEEAFEQEDPNSELVYVSTGDSGARITLYDSYSGYDEERPRFVLELSNYTPGVTYTLGYRISGDVVISEVGKDDAEYVNNEVAVRSEAGDEASDNAYAAFSRPFLEKTGTLNQDGRIVWQIVVNRYRQDIGGMYIEDWWNDEFLEEYEDLSVANQDGSPVEGFCWGWDYKFEEGETDTFFITYTTDAVPLEGENYSNNGVILYDSKTGNSVESLWVDVELTPDSGSGDDDHGMGLTKTPLKDDDEKRPAIVDDVTTRFWWHVVIDMPEGYEGPVTYRDELLDENGNTDPGYHYSTVGELTERLDSGIGYGIETVRPDAAASYTFYNHDTIVTDLDDRVTAFEIVFTAEAPWEGEGFSFNYPSYGIRDGSSDTLSDSGSGYLYTYNNWGAVTHEDVTLEKHTAWIFEDKLNLEKQVITESGDYTADAAVIAFDPEARTIGYRLVIRTEAGMMDDIHITDTFPDGLEPVTDGNAAPYAAFADGSTSFTYDGTTYDLADPKNFSVEKSETGNSRYILDMVIKGGEGNFGYNGNASGKNEGNTIYVYYEASIDEALADRFLSGDEAVREEFLNVAEITIGSFGDETDQGTTVTNRVIQKNGVQDRDRLKYSIVINADGLDLMPEGDTLTLTDVLTVPDRVYVQLNPDSIRLYDYASGNKGEEMESPPYNYEEETHTLDVTVPDETACLLEYEYAVDTALADSFAVDNHASLSGWHSSFQNIEVSASSLGGTVTQRRFTIYKVDSKQTSTRLPGASFVLERYVGDGWEEAGSYTTGEEGTVVINTETTDVIDTYTLYRLRETDAPAGYLLPETCEYLIFKDQRISNETAYSRTFESLSAPEELNQADIHYTLVSGSVTIENEQELDYFFPETGGAGTAIFLACSFPFFAASFLLLRRKK